MTDKEYMDRRNELLNRVPEEFRAVLWSMAYQDSHSNGPIEILLYLEDYVEILKGPIEKFGQRMNKEGWDEASTSCSS